MLSLLERARAALSIAALAAIALALVAGVAAHRRTALLEEKVRLLERVVDVQDRWCSGLGEVNLACEESFTEIAARLGLDARWMPLVNTAMWRRATRGKSIARARRELGASRWQSDPPLGENR